MTGKNVSFNEFVENAYKGIPARTSTVKDKERAIAAKKKIMNHPDCPNDSKVQLKKEISIIEEEIARINSEQRSQSMNSSVFGTRNDLG